MTTSGSTGVGDVVGGSAFGSLLTSLSPQPAVTSSEGDHQQCDQHRVTSGVTHAAESSE